MTFIRAYLRASTQEQDASRARSDLIRFAEERGQRIAAFYVENESGATLHRPELFRLLSDCQPGDVLLIEQVDRLSRLNAADWERLRGEIASRRVRIVALDLPTSWTMLNPATASEQFTGRMFEAINNMLLDMLAAIARKDYEDRRRRQAQGIAARKAEDKADPSQKQGYVGRPENTERNAAILAMLKAGHSWSSIQKATGCGRATLARLRVRLDGEEVKAASARN